MSISVRATKKGTLNVLEEFLTDSERALRYSKLSLRRGNPSPGLCMRIKPSVITLDLALGLIRILHVSLAKSMLDFSSITVVSWFLHNSDSLLKSTSAPKSDSLIMVGNIKSLAPNSGINNSKISFHVLNYLA